MRHFRHPPSAYSAFHHPVGLSILWWMIDTVRYSPDAPRFVECPGYWLLLGKPWHFPCRTNVFRKDSGCWCNLEIISPGNRTRDSTVPSCQNYRWATDEIISSAWSDYINMERVKACPGVVNTLGTPRSAEHPGSIIPDQSSIKEWTGRQDDERPSRPTVGGRVKPHEMLLRDSESRSTGSRFWCNLNLKIMSPGSRTRDFTVDTRYNYRYAAKALYQALDAKSSRRSSSCIDCRPWNPGFDSREKQSSD